MSGGDPLYVMDQISDQQNKGTKMGGESSRGSGIGPPWRAGTVDIIELRFFEGNDTDGSGRYDLHFPGAGEPSGEMCPQKYAPVSELISGCFFIPFIL